MNHLRIITRKQLRDIVPWTPQHVLRLEKAGKFPKRIRFGNGPSGRVGWLMSDIETWLNERKTTNGSAS